MEYFMSTSISGCGDTASSDCGFGSVGESMVGCKGPGFDKRLVERSFPSNYPKFRYRTIRLFGCCTVESCCTQLIY